jgi:hypothetical protein
MNTKDQDKAKAEHLDRTLEDIEKTRQFLDTPAGKVLVNVLGVACLVADLANGTVALARRIFRRRR